MSIAVVGGGIIGFSTACLLRERLDPRIDVTLVAEKFGLETTSYGAAGISRIKKAPDNDEVRFRRWACESFNHFYKMARSGDAYKAGIITMPVYDLQNVEDPPLPFYKDVNLDVTKVSRATLTKMRLPEDCKSAFRILSTLVEPRYHLPFLREKFEMIGGQIERRRLTTLSELASDFDLAVNCTGLGARALCNDQEMVPIRGQIVRVKAPWLRHAWNCDHRATYIYPGRDLTALGAVRAEGVEDYSISDTDTAKILEKTRQIDPSLSAAVVEEIWVGMRPYRKKVRLETDPTTFDLPIVHNYGHGSHGVGIGYGTSIEAAERAEILLKRLNAKL